MDLRDCLSGYVVQIQKYYGEDLSNMCKNNFFWCQKYLAQIVQVAYCLGIFQSEIEAKFKLILYLLFHDADKP